MTDKEIRLRCIEAANSKLGGSSNNSVVEVAKSYYDFIIAPQAKKQKKDLKS